MTEFVERHYTAQDGLKLYFRDYPCPQSTRTPILCLPGLARNSKDFAILAQHLSGERRVICPDLRGRGRSAYDPQWQHYTGPTYISDLMHLLTVTNCHHVVIIGTSMGGLMAMAMSVFMPSSIAAVIFNDVGPEVPDTATNHILDAIGKPPTHNDWPAATAYLRKLWPHLANSDENTVLNLAKDTYRQCDDGLIRSDWDPNIVRPLVEKTDDVPDLWLLYRALRNTPLLALRAEHSDVLTPDIFSRMKQEIPALFQAVVPATGHCPTMNEPVSREAIDVFLADN
ncbi:MAG: alpha/beta fold hydrolase [Alphaproteobacteria bacterium]